MVFHNGGGRPRPTLLRRWGLTAALLVLALLAYCVHDAVSLPGKDGASAKLARWSRCHYLGYVADVVDGHPRTAPSGDCSASDALTQAQPLAAAKPKPRPTPTVTPVPLHARVRPLVSPARPGEGVFTPLSLVKGQPVIQSATMRPDPYDTDFPVGVVWMRNKALTFQLHPGAEEPGGSWAVPSTIPAGRRTGLLAAYNGGFKLSNGDSHGGFYLNGRTAVPLRSGAASEVFHRDGSLSVGVWNQDVAMAPDVVGVRQCLVPLVSHGAVTDAVRYGGTDVWGLTDGGNASVPRSGVGIDRHGDIVYVGGRELTVQSLATVLQRAGAVTAMMLDINLSWPSFISYDGKRQPRDPVPHNLVNFVRDATRYYDESSRDFVAVYARR
ncbi:phosphodiester glycosidase family protein [Streptacidiphilus sp. N1-12]|uniref:Phosphodiester glycosidase family protein n=2 Tax=Streptacidiphilus alkalitolerans TaxID=3342712 RepID=A0ABV6WNW1_9ACTN